MALPMMAGMALGSASGSLLGGLFGGGDDVTIPELDTSAYDNLIKNLGKYTGDITGLSQAGELQSKYLQMQKLQDMANAQSRGLSSGLTAQSNASMFGADAGARERMANRNLAETTRATSDMSNKYAQMQQQLEAGDIGQQEDRRFNIETNVLPNAELAKMNLINDRAMANAQGQMAENQARSSRNTGLFGSLGMLGGYLATK